MEIYTREKQEKKGNYLQALLNRPNKFIYEVSDTKDTFHHKMWKTTYFLFTQFF